MTKAQKLELRERKLRSELRKLASKETLSEDERTEMREKEAEFNQVEEQLTVLKSLEDEKEVETRDTEDAETRALKKLEGRVSFGEYIKASVEMRSVREGPEREYNEHLKIGADSFPLQALAPSEDELRATTNVDTKTMPKRWIDRLFYGTAASRLGVNFQSVSPGVPSYPMTTAGATSAQRGRGEAIGDAAWTFSTKELKPTRAGVRATFNVEDVARIGPELEAAIVRDLRAALVSGIDKSIFLGDAGANENSADITGLQTLAISESEITQGDKVKADKTLETFVSFVDGLHAESMSDVRVVTSVPANTLWMTTIHNSAASNETIAQFLRASGMSWSTRGELSDGTGDSKFGAYVSLARGVAGTAVAPVWMNSTMVRDPYSGSAQGSVAVTLHSLWNFGLVRASNWKRVKFVS